MCRQNNLIHQFIFCLLFPIFLFAESIIPVQIKVIHNKDSSPIPYSQIAIPQAGKFYTTNEKGEVYAKLPKTGNFTFRIIAAGRVVKKQREILYPNQKLTFSIAKAKQGGILVEGEKDKVKLSRFSLKKDEIKRLPGVSGDSLKAIQTLPGISPAPPIGLNSSSFSSISNRLPNTDPYINSESGYLVMRGAGSLANGYYLDGFLITYPYHLGNQSSVVNNNLIRSFDIYTGAYPIQYGFATGGIIAIKSTNQVKKSYTIWNLNTFLTDIYHQQKISDTMYAIASARKSYPNIALSKLYPAGIPENAKFSDYEDYQFKWNYKPHPGHEILILLFGARDLQNYTKAVAELEENSSSELGIFGRQSNRPPVGIDRRFRTEGFRYTYSPSRKLKMSLAISNNSFSENFELDFKNPATAETILGLKNRTEQSILFIETINSFQIWKKFLNINFGAQYRQNKIVLQGEDLRSSNPDFLELFNNLIESDRSFRALIEGDLIRSKEVSSFAELEIHYGGFSLFPGVRTDFYDLSREKKTSRRIRASYTFSQTDTTLLAGYGEHYQAPSKLEYISNFSGNPNLKMEYSEHASGGLEQKIFKNYLFKMEGYRNVFKNLITPDAYKIDPYYLNNNTRDFINKTDEVLENPFLQRELNFSNNRDGYSYGMEIYLKKFESKKIGWFGWISYSNSITKRNNHKRRPEEDEENDRRIKNATRKLIYQHQWKTHYINLYDNEETEILYDNDREELYDLDRTHILNLVFGWKFIESWQIGGRYSYLTGQVITPIINAEPVSIGGGTGVNFYTAEFSEFYNSGRYKNFHQLDIRIDRFFNYHWGYLNYYIEFINLFGYRSQVDRNFNSFAPYSDYAAGRTLKNPEEIFFTNYIESKVNGKVKYLPLLSIGLEVRF